MSVLRETVKRIPLVRDVARWASTRFAALGRDDFNSAEYWENRYSKGRNSGPGSYNRLAEFKAEVLNAFVESHKVQSVLEFGSGDGAQLALAEYPKYTGVDVSPTIIEQARARYAGDDSKSFVLLGDLTDERADLTMSLDVIYHLIEDAVFDAHMRELFERSTRYVVIYASNTDELADSVHVRHRKFSDWVEANRKNFALIKTIPNAYPFDRSDPDNTSFADFYFYERTD